MRAPGNDRPWILGSPVSIHQRDLQILIPVEMGFVIESSVLAHGVIFLILNPISVLGRSWMRRKTNSWGLDDWFCIPALVGFTLLGRYRILTVP